MKETLLHTHGRRTYAMAWVVEFGLFGLAIGIAIFNIMSVIETGGTIMNAILLGVGWFIIGLVELSTIPLAGALRITKWRDKWLALIGVIGMTFLSAWTVYEFNEFASYSMTMPARKALITIENKENEINALKDQNVKMIDNNTSANEKLNTIRKEKAKLIEGNLNQRKAKLSQITSERDVEIRELDSQIEEINNHGPLNIAQKSKINDNEKEIQRLLEEMDSKIDEVKKRADVAKSDNGASASASKETLNEQISQINQKISRLNQQKITEVGNIKSGLFSESKKNKVRASYNNQIKEQESELAMIRKELSKKNLAFDSSEFDQEIASVKSEYEPQMNLLRAENKKIREVANKESAALVLKLNKEVEGLNLNKKDVISKYALLLSSAKQESESARVKIDQEYGKKISEYMDAIKTDAEVQNKQSENEITMVALQAEINSLVKDIELQMEPVLYYRIAKWFHPEEGLPSKEAYLKAQTNIFAPMGIFFGIVSIALAYIGTGLKRDSEFPEELEKDNKQQAKKIKIMENRIQNVSDELEKEKFGKLQWKQEQLDEMEKRKDRTISVLQAALDSSIENVVESKKVLAETVKSIPQKIVMRDDVQDLAVTHRYNTVDFAPDELSGNWNSQSVEAA